MCMATKVVVFFHGCKDIYLIYLITAAVTFRDYDSQSDGLSS